MLNLYSFDIRTSVGISNLIIYLSRKLLMVASKIFPMMFSYRLTLSRGGGAKTPALLILAISPEWKIGSLRETYVHKIVLDHQPNFHKDPCKDARARGVNARTRDEMRTRAFTPRARASLHGSL